MTSKTFTETLLKPLPAPHTTPSACREKLQPSSISSCLPPKPWGIHYIGVLYIISLLNAWIYKEFMISSHVIPLAVYSLVICI